MKLLLALLLSLVAMPLMGGIVTNGIFTSDAAGWTFADTDGAYYRSSGGNPGGYAVLNNGPVQVPTMSQTVTLIAGHTYQLTWDMISAYTAFTGGGLGVGVAIDGHLWEYAVPNTQSSWLSYSETFTASSGSAILAFSAQRNGLDEDAGFDNIVLTDSDGAVPEPASLALLGTGLALFLLKRLARV